MRTAKTDQTGRMPRLISVFAGRTCHYVSLVMRRLMNYFHMAHFYQNQDYFQMVKYLPRTITCLYSFEVIPLLMLLNSSYIYFTPLEPQVQHFMYLHVYVPYLLSEFIPLCRTKTWLSVQNCITPIAGRHQFSRRKQILVIICFVSISVNFQLFEP